MLGCVLGTAINDINPGCQSTRDNRLKWGNKIKNLISRGAPRIKIIIFDKVEVGKG